MKRLLMMGAMMLAMASCATDPKDPFEGDNNLGNETPEVTEVAPGVYTLMSGDVTRVVSLTDEGATGFQLLPPTNGHKFSATGIAFGEDDYVYVSWHTNRKGDVDANEEFNHDHGTNVNGDVEPSLDDLKSWGGAVDVFKVGNAGVYEFAGTLTSTEHKYNHVLYNDGKLYLPSTSNRLGAALDVITLKADGTLPSESEYNGASSYRINLTGRSANCVEVVGDELVTISGRTVGSINWFSLDSKEDQRNKAFVTDSMNYGGKHLFLEGEKLYALHNYTKGMVTVYNGKSEEKTLELQPKIKEYFTTYYKDYAGYEEYLKDDATTMTLALYPIDGKNVVYVKDGKLYVCCGHNSFHVFDVESGNRVGGSHKHANACDVATYNDKEYVFIATGGGLAILDPTTTDVEYRKDENGKWLRYTQADAEANRIPDKISEESKNSKNPHKLGVGDRKEFTFGNWKTVKYVQYVGTPDAEVEESVKESANFVKVHDGKVFVAYGMYGLHIYDLESLFSEANDEAVEGDDEEVDA